jgi:hypothetical protein
MMDEFKKIWKEASWLFRSNFWVIAGRDFIDSRIFNNSRVLYGQRFKSGTSPMHVRGVIVEVQMVSMGFSSNLWFFVSLVEHFHVLCGQPINIYFYFSVSFFFTSLSDGTETSISKHAPFLSRSLMSGLLHGLVLSVTSCWFQNIVTWLCWIYYTPMYAPLYCNILKSLHYNLEKAPTCFDP